MGDTLYEVLSRTRAFACRIYAPVGSFTDLLPYLVRRLLENGANTSFVHQIADPAVPLEALVADPLEALPEPYSPDPRIPLPRNLYPDRLNSLGVDLARRDVLDSLEEKIGADRGRESLGAVESTTARELDFSIARAAAAFDSWTRVPAAERAAALERAADAMERRMIGSGSFEGASGPSAANPSAGHPSSGLPARNCRKRRRLSAFTSEFCTVVSLGLDQRTQAFGNVVRP